MRVAYQYKLLPTTKQRAIMNKWLDMLRCEYNYLLAERYNWWEQNRCDINACPLICHLPELKDNPDYYSQKRNLVSLKQERHWYKDIYSQVLQDCVTRVKLAFDRFIKGDSKGNRSGRPRFKGKNRYRSFTYTQMSNDDVVGNRINLAKIGWVKLILHRPIPEGFKVKTAIVSQKADGWYVSISLQDDMAAGGEVSSPTLADSVPENNIDIAPNWDNSIALDLGLEKFASDSSGDFEPIPQHFRTAESQLGKIQQKVATRKKGSRARKLLCRKAAKLHQKIARQRRQFHFETVKKTLQKADVIFVEDLVVKNMNRRCKPKTDESGKFLPNGQAVKSGMNKSIADAGWSQFIDILVVKVDPRGTSQHCSSCLNKVPKELSDRWHSCPCGLELDRDTNSAILIKKVGLGVAPLKNAQPKITRKRSYHQVVKLGA